MLRFDGSRRLRPARGYSLIAVLFVVMMLALMGTAAFTLAGADVSSAESTELRSQALATAEAGLQIFATTADPTAIPDQTADESTIVPNGLGGPGAFEYRYLIIGAGNTGEVGHFISEGQVVRDDKVISRARIWGSILVQAWEDPYSGTHLGGAAGTNVSRTGLRPPFAGGPSL